LWHNWIAQKDAVDLLEVPVRNGGKELEDQVTFTPKHRCEVMLKRMAEAIEC